jgi:hypothetical protein
MPQHDAVNIRALIVPWLAGVVGYLVGLFGSGVWLRAIAGSSGASTAAGLSWISWVAPAVLAGLAAGVVARPRATARRADLAAAVLPPTALGVLIVLAFASVTGIMSWGVVPAALAQLAIALVVGLPAGTARDRLRRPDQGPAPVTYTTQEDRRA